MKRPLIIALVSTALMVAYASLVMGSQSPEGAENAGGLPDTRFGGYTADDLSAYFIALGPSQVETYSRMLAIWDNLFPLVYGAMNMAWLSFIIGSLGIRRFRWIAIALPMAGMCLDWCENYFIRAQLLLFQIGSPLDDGNPAALFSQLKWSVSVPMNILILAGIVASIILAVRRRRKTSHSS